MPAARRLNKRLVAMLTIGMIVLFAITTFLVLKTAKKDPGPYGEQGDKYMEKRDFTNAAKAYETAFLRSDNDTKWLMKACEALLAAGEPPRALGALRRALIANPNLIEAQKRHVEIFYDIWGRGGSAGNMRYLQEQAEKLLNMLSKADQNDPEVRKTLALAKHCQGLGLYARRAENPDFVEEAKKAIQSAMDLDIKADYIRSLALIPWIEATQLAQMAAADNIDLGAYDEFVKQIHAKLAEAENLYLDAIKRAPEDSEMLLGLGTFYIHGKGTMEAALESFCRIQAQGRQRVKTQYDLAQKEIQANRAMTPEERHQKTVVLSRKLDELLREIPNWNKRADTHETAATQTAETAEQTLNRSVDLARDTSQKVEALVALGSLLLTQNKYDQVEEIANQAIALDEEEYAPYQLAYRVYRMQANTLKGEEATKKIAQAEQVLTHRLNEVRHTLTGPKAYIAKLNRADLILSLAQLYLTRREGDDLKKTADLLNQLEHELGEHPRVYQLRGELATVENRIIQAIRYYQKAESLDEGNVLTKLALADLHFRRGETGAAEKILNEVLRQAPDNRGARRLAASVQLVQNNPEKAMEHIDWLLTTVDEENRREPLLLKLEALIRLDRFDEAQTVTNTLAEMGVKVDLRIQRAARLAGEQKYTEAETLLKQVLADEPGNKRATGMVVAIYDQQNRKDDARAIVDQALVQHPDDESFRQMKTLLATDNEEERRRLRDQIRDKSLAEALEVVKEEKDPYRREVAMVNQYLIRNDMKSAKKHLDAAIALDSNRTIRLNFQFALFTKDWNRAEQCVVLAREGNLDGLNGRYYQAQLTSARAWDYANDANQKKPDEAKQTFQQAADQLEPLIAELPDDSLLRALLGEAYVWLDRPDEAESQINEALVLGPENPYVRRAQALRQWLMIAESSVVSNQELASDFVNNVMIASSKLPRDEWLATKRDWIKEQNQLTEEYQDDEKGDPEKVAERREARRKEDPKDLRNLIRLAWVYENREKVKDLDKAEQCHQQAIEQEPVAVVMREYLAFASRHKRMESLEAYLKGLANKFGQNGNGDGYTLLGVYYHSLGQNEPAETSLLQAVKINDNASKQLGLAVFYNRLSQTEKTIEWAQKTLQSAPTAQQDRTARMLLITGLLQTSQWDKAADQIDQYQKSFPGPLGKMYAVRLALAREDVSKAEQILTEVLETNPGYADALDVRAKIFMDTWRLDQAQKDLERLKSISPRGFGNLGHIRLAKLYCELGRPTDAVNEARNVLSAINDRPDWYEPARINLILPLSSSLPDADMVELLIWAGNKQTTYWGWPFERGRLLLRQKKYNDACTAMADAWKLAKDGPMSLRLSVLDQYQQALFQAKRYDEIVRIADSVLAEADSPIPGVLAWRAAALYAKGNHQEAANTYFKSLELAKDQPLVIWQITHEGFLHAISARELIPLLEEKLNSSPNEMKTSLKLALAGTYLSANEIDKGYPLYKEVVSSFSKPVDQTMIWYLASQQFGEQNKQQTVEALREARKLDPDNVAVLNNLAYCLNEDLGQSEEAMKLIKPAYQKSPNNPELLDTYGRIQQKLGQKDQALVSFSRSVWAQEIATSRYHLATLLMELNRDLEARVQLERALVLAEDDKQLESSIRETLKNVRKE